jgi:hypothetical protein
LAKPVEAVEKRPSVMNAAKPQRLKTKVEDRGQGVGCGVGTFSTVSIEMVSVVVMVLPYVDPRFRAKVVT